jgi:predicted transcriptional regulator
MKLRVTTDVHRKVNEIAERRAVPPTEIVREAIAEYLDRHRSRRIA